MTQFSSELENAENGSLIAKISGYVGALISLGVIFTICLWTVKWYDREINDLPVIAALQNEFRVQPSNPEGKPINFQDLSVNKVLDNREDDFRSEKIELAPLPEQLDEVDKSPPVSLPSTQNDSHEAIANSIKAALESLLGVENAQISEHTGALELHIGSFSTVEKANAHWFLLKQLNPKLLDHYEMEVKRLQSVEQTIYRLRVVGFESLVVAKDICERLNDRGEQCVPVIPEE